MSEQPSYLKDISLIIHPDGETTVSEETLLKWFDFLGGKPGEVVLVDNGSHIEVQDAYWTLFHKRLIDKLQLSQPSYREQAQAEEHIQIYMEGSIACKPYILWFSTHLIPHRQGQDDWLKEAIGYLDRDEVMAVSSSLNARSITMLGTDGITAASAISILR
ncbi:MAG: hypothetical protein HC769_08395 [Cyanobacteria bacterium CRU_2_1]|nr:hypothetical protein [Cyanobacteria bacterium CRU_2_1]